MARCGARGRGSDCKVRSVLASGGTLRDEIPLKVNFDVVQRVGIARLFVVFGGPHLSAGINLAQIIQARLLVGRAARADKIGDRDSRQQTNNGDRDHDLDQSPPRCSGRPRSFEAYFTHLSVRAKSRWR